MGLYVTLVPPQGYSFRMAYRHIAIYSYTRALLVNSVASLTFLPVARFFEVLTLQPFPKS
jgi:hypothetical protein